MFFVLPPGLFYQFRQLIWLLAVHPECISRWIFLVLDERQMFTFYCTFVFRSEPGKGPSSWHRTERGKTVLNQSFSNCVHTQKIPPRVGVPNLTENAKIENVQVLCNDINKYFKAPKKIPGPGWHSTTLGGRDQLSSFENFPDFTEFWTITKRLADSQRIANLQRGPACRFEKFRPVSLTILSGYNS